MLPKASLWLLVSMTMGAGYPDGGSKLPPIRQDYPSTDQWAVSLVDGFQRCGPSGPLQREAFISGCPCFLGELEETQLQKCHRAWPSGGLSGTTGLLISFHAGLVMVVKRFVSLWAALSYGYRSLQSWPRHMPRSIFFVCQAQRWCPSMHFGSQSPYWDS